jgi:hypothetical protein
MARAIAASRMAESKRLAVGITASLDSGCDVEANGKAIASAGCSIVVELWRANANAPESRRAIQVLGSLGEAMEGGLFLGELYLEQRGKLQPMTLVRLFLSTSTIISTA